MKQKKYNAVKVDNPVTDGHSVRLYPRQSFQLFLDKVFEDDQYDIILRSDFLIIEDIRTEGLRMYFLISQKYDLSDWAVVSSVFLGNVSIRHKAKNNTTEIQLCVFLEAENKIRGETLTVINPLNNLIKLEPCQILKIVVFDEVFTKWSMSGIDSLNCDKSETVFNDYTGVYDKNDLFCSDQRAVDMPINGDLKSETYNLLYQKEYVNKSQRRVTKEYHFWLSLTGETLRYAHHLTNGNHDLGIIYFNGSTHEDGDDVFKQLQLRVMLSLRGSTKRLNIDKYNAVKFHSQHWNQRFCSPDRISLINPSLADTIDLTVDNDWMYVEIPQPSVYFGKDYDEHVYWYPEMVFDHACQINVRIKELTVRHVNGVSVQRFVISDIIKNAPPDDLSFIGVVRFVCNMLLDSREHNTKYLVLTLWKVKTLAKQSSIQACRFNYNSSQIDKTNFSYSLPTRTNHQDRSNWVTQIELEQMEFKGLEEGVSVLSLESITGKPTKGNYGYEDEYDCYPGYVMYPQKKKDTCPTRIHFRNNSINI